MSVLSTSNDIVAYGHRALRNAGIGQSIDGHDDSQTKTVFCEALVALCSPAD